MVAQTHSSMSIFLLPASAKKIITLANTSLAKTYFASSSKLALASVRNSQALNNSTIQDAI
jgi:hypothetical protein